MEIDIRMRSTLGITLIANFVCILFRIHLSSLRNLQRPLRVGGENMLRATGETLPNFNMPCHGEE